MNEPNPDLLRQYGTLAVLQKTAGAAPFAAQVASKLLDAGLLTQSAQQLNEQFRLLEGHSGGGREPSVLLPNALTPTTDLLPGSGDEGLPSDAGKIRLASIAASVGQHMAKQAGIGTVLQGAGQALKPYAAGFGANGRLMRAAQQAGVAPAAKPGLFAAPATRRLMNAEAGAHVPTQSHLAPSQPVQQSQPANLVSGQTPQQPAKPGFMQETFGPHWKAKGLALGALAGGGYLGLKGLQSGLDYLSGESHPQNYAAPGGYTLPMGVNAYGQPQLGTPLM